MKKRWIFAGVLTLLGLILLVASRVSVEFSDFYCQNIYPVITFIPSYIWGFYSFSVGEIVLYLFIAAAAVMAVVTVVRVIKWRGERVSVLLSCLSWYGIGAGLIFLLLTANCLVGYNRTPFSAYSGLELTSYSKEELFATTEEVIAQVNNYSQWIETDENGICKEGYNMKADASAAMEKLAEKYEVLQIYYYPQPKPVLWSEGMSYLDLAGIYFPFTVEANYNDHMPASSKGFTACHELSHLTGFIREDEANFIAFLACRESYSPYLRYSGYLNALVYLLNACYPMCGEGEYQELYAQLNDQVKTELAYRSQYWNQYKDTVTAQVSSAANDAYLKSNNQTDGTKSYGRVVDLLIADYLARQAEAAQ